MAIRWSGPLAPYGVMTGDRRMFKAGTIDHRDLPLPLSYQSSSARGHTGSVVVGSIDHIDVSTNPIQGSGTWLSEEDEPAVRPAMAKVRAGIVGPSVDLDNFEAEIADHSDGEPYLNIKQGRISGATLVAIPAFAGQRLTLHDDDIPESMMAAAWTFEEFESPAEFGVNSSAWQNLPIAPRNAPFSADIAIKRIADWSGGDTSKFNSAFLWKDPNRADNDMRAYRLPIGDIIDGKLTVIYHAIYAAAALIQGAHGGLPGIPDADKATLKGIINKMYAAMGKTFDEPLEPPWDQGQSNRKALSMNDPEPELEGTLVAGGGPLAPSRQMFDQPELPEDTVLPYVSPDGRVFTYVAEWNTCHVGFEDVCVTSPKSKTDYGRFHLGSVLTSEGDTIRVGKISLGGGHAQTNARMQAAVDHYDNVSTAIAIVRAGEDDRGVYVAGALLPGITDEQVAAFRRSPLSGDWRRDDSVENLELVAALCVNVPGFPLSYVASGQQMSLVAACVPNGLPEFAETPVETPVVEAAESDEQRQERIGRLAAMMAADQVKRGERLKAFKE